MEMVHWVVFVGLVCILGLVRSENSGVFEQKVDHFESGSGTFRQRYFVAAPEGYEGVSGVAFLMISGENAMDPFGGVWIEHANKLKDKRQVALFELEHRYYGRSWPTPGYEFLSSDQALEDIRYFVLSMTSMYHLERFKWVLFGGSYAGALAAWARQKFPDLIHAAVSSSAPLEAKADLDGYLEIVRKSLTSVSHSCSGLVTDLAWKQHQLVSDVEFLVQYGFQENACKIASCLANTGDYQSCRNEWYHFYSKPYSQTFDLSFGAFVKRGFHSTAWQYQQCTEFGWFPTSGKTSSLFGDLYPLSSFVYYSCQNDYNALYKGVARVNSEHGGKNFTTDRVLFLHGSLDPYVVAGVTSSTPGTPVYIIQGGSHCLDMRTVADVSWQYRNQALTDEVIHAHELTMKYLLEWLKE